MYNRTHSPWNHQHRIWSSTKSHWRRHDLGLGLGTTVTWLSENNLHCTSLSKRWALKVHRLLVSKHMVKSHLIASLTIYTNPSLLLAKRVRQNSVHQRIHGTQSPVKGIHVACCHWVSLHTWRGKTSASRSLEKPPPSRRWQRICDFKCLPINRLRKHF